MTYKLRTALALLGVLGLAIPPMSASALPLIPVGSEIDFNGAVDPVGGNAVYNATGLDFRTSGSAGLGTPGSLGLTNTASGAFTAFTAGGCPSEVVGGCGMIVDLASFNVGTATLITPTLPVLNFLTFTQGLQVVSFTLNSFTITDVLPTVNSLGTMTLSGSGELSYQGYAPTLAIFTITAQNSGNTSFSGSLVSQAQPVPEPASLILMGVGMLALGGMAYRRRTTGVAHMASTFKNV